MDGRSVVLLFILSVAGWGQSQGYPNVNKSLAGWQYNPPCEGSDCAGGTGLPTSTSLTVGVSSPSLDGASAKFTIVAPALSKQGLTTNVLWPWKAGANNNWTTFVGTYHIYLPEVANIAALEFDLFQFNNGQRYMYGSECDQGGSWRIWNQLTGSWVGSGFSCNLFTADSWHTVTWMVHRVPGDRSCSGQPCLHYDTLIVDAVSYSGFIPQPSAPSADPNNNGIQFQIDESYLGGTAIAYVDEMNLTVSTGVTAPMLSEGPVQ